MLKTQISFEYFFWEHQEYQNRHPGAHFGTSLARSWGGARKRLLAHGLEQGHIQFSISKIEKRKMNSKIRFSIFIFKMQNDIIEVIFNFLFPKRKTKNEFVIRFFVFDFKIEKRKMDSKSVFRLSFSK